MCIFLLCGCKKLQSSGSKDTNASCVETSVVIDTVKGNNEITDTTSLDSLMESGGYGGGIGGSSVKWERHHFSKILYEIEFLYPGLEDSIIEYIDSIGKRDEYLANADVYKMYIDEYLYDNNLTCVTITPLDIDQDGIDLEKSSSIDGYGYAIIRNRIALVSKSSYTTCTGKNPRQMDFKYYTITYERPEDIWYTIDMIDNEYGLILDLRENRK